MPKSEKISASVQRCGNKSLIVLGHSTNLMGKIAAKIQEVGDQNWPNCHLTSRSEDGYVCVTVDDDANFQTVERAMRKLVGDVVTAFNTPLNIVVEPATVEEDTRRVEIYFNPTMIDYDNIVGEPLRSGLVCEWDNRSHGYVIAIRNPVVASQDDLAELVSAIIYRIKGARS